MQQEENQTKTNEILEQDEKRLLTFKMFELTVQHLCMLAYSMDAPFGINMVDRKDVKTESYFK